MIVCPSRLKPAGLGLAPQVVRLLLKLGVDRNRGGKSGLTALHAACHCGHSKVVKLLAEAEVVADGQRQPHPTLDLSADGGMPLTFVADKTCLQKPQDRRWEAVTQQISCAGKLCLMTTMLAHCVVIRADGTACGFSDWQR